SRAWLPASATECTLSASIEADPEMRNATNFVTAMPEFASNAARIALLPPEALMRSILGCSHGYRTSARRDHRHRLDGRCDPGRAARTRCAARRHSRDEPHRGESCGAPTGRRRIACD